MNAVTETPATETLDPLTFTDNAANKVKQLIEEEGNTDLKLRVFVSGGGCSGFQYLAGSEIDYQEGLEGSQFVIKNPGAASTCGCGSSFSA